MLSFPKIQFISKSIPILRQLPSSRSGDTDLDQLACVKTRCAGLKTLQHKIEMGSVPIKS